MAAIPAALAVHRLDADQYGRIVATGGLADQRVELIDGVILDMSPQSPRHSLIVERLTAHLGRAAARLRVQLGLQVSGDSVLEPDLALVQEPARPDRHPTTAALVIEVAVSSQALDRGRKADLYATAGVPVYWVVDTAARAVEVRSDPGPARYRTLRTYGAGEIVPSPCEGVDELAVDALLAGIE